MYSLNQNENIEPHHGWLNTLCAVEHDQIWFRWQLISNHTRCICRGVHGDGVDDMCGELDILSNILWMHIEINVNW